MANINITLRMNKINYNITSIVDTGNLNKEIEMEISTEGTFNTASFIIPAVERYELGPNIDFSRGIIRNSLITIERDQVEYQWRVMGDTVAENQNGTYTHTVNLIDRRSETTGINIPGLTLTQSKSERGEVINSTSTINKTGVIGNGLYNYDNYTFSPDIKHGINITPSTPIIPLTTFIPSSDTDVINGLVIKDADGEREYEISIDMTLVNTQNSVLVNALNLSFVENYNQDINYIIKIKANGEVIYSEPRTLLGGKAKVSVWSGVPAVMNLTTTKLNKILKIKPLVETTISLEVEVLPDNPFTRRSVGPGSDNTKTFPDTLSISDLSLSIFTTTSDNNPSKKSLEYWVDKILNSIYIDETPPYTLSAASRARLSQIVAPEFTIDGYNLYQAIQEVADFLGTSWEINKDDEIDFIFFDDTTIIDFNDEQKQTTTGVSDLSDYASAMQINAENIASNSIKKEYDITVRAIDEGNARITTDNLMIKTEEPINYISKVIFKGIDLVDLNGVNYSQDWDITSRVVTKEEWDILPSNFDPSYLDPDSGRNILMKNNTLYFIRGQKGLYGLSYVGGAKPTFTGNPNINRALFEVIAATAYQSLGRDTITKDGGIATQNALKVDIEYYPFVSSDINIYKDDQSGFQIERHKYFNESSRVNDPELLGKVAQNTVNRLGGTEYTTTGYLETLVGIPRLGTINSDNRRLTKLILQMTDAYIRYTATYISDYTKISKFVGKKSDYRLYEIPNTAVIESNRLKRNKIIFGSNKPTPSHLLKFLWNFQDAKLPLPNIAKLDFYHSLGTSTVYAGIISNEFGKSASWKVKMPTNYSAGLKKVVRPSDESDPESVPVWFQEEVKYTDNMGTIDSVDVTYAVGGQLGDDYPSQASIVPSSFITTQYYEYNKDAREIFSIEYEVAFSTNNQDKYRIYDGITKYNSFINGRTDYTIECRVLDYIPNRNDVKVDLTRCHNYLCSVAVWEDEKVIKVGSNGGGQGLVFYDKLSLDILLVVKDIIEDTATAGYYRIPIGAPEDLIIRNVTFMENGGTSVPNQQVVNGTLIAEVLTTTSKTGCTFGGWYTESGFVNLFDFDTPITSNITLYAKWINVSNHAWRRIYTTIVDETIYPSIESFTCPLDYASLLPSANNYDLNHVIEVIPVRQCDPENDTCEQDPITNEWYKLCPSQQFKVYDITDYTIYSGPLISGVDEDNLLSVYSGIQLPIYNINKQLLENVQLNSYGLTVYDSGNIEVLFYEDGIYITNGLTDYIYGLPK